MISTNAPRWVDWIPCDGAFGEWHFGAIAWGYERIDSDVDAILTVNLENSRGQLQLRFCPWLTRILDEHSVALEAGYVSYQRHSLYLIPESALVHEYVENPHRLRTRELPALTHYRIICLDQVVDVLAACAPRANLKLQQSNQS